MKTFILSFIFIFSAAVNTFAQRYIFRMYRFECSELFGIDLTKPKGFKVVDGMTTFRVNEKRNIGTIYRMTLESKDKNCLILFPYFDVIENNNTVSQNMAYGELKAVLNLGPEDDMRLKTVNGIFMMQGESNSKLDNQLIELDSAKYVKTITGDNMENYFNADTVFIWKAPLQNEWSASLSKYNAEIYTECIGINVIKTGHPSGIIKILLTEEGKKKEEEYLQALFRSIHYSDIAPNYDQEKREITVKKVKSRYKFHYKKYMLK
ncbi:hypothetical protein AAH119_17790 [Bacteroides thetaiotaomicron]|uniref:hypothetical protein n=1 Tax=Bacteroides thetaiotaomicron TaxID=818 RepID=UPI0039B626B3